MTLSCHKLRGTFDKKISVSTNDPNNQRVNLTCKGQILEPVKIEPQRINFGKVARGAKKEQLVKKVSVLRGDGEPIKPVLKPITVKNIEAELKEIEAGERYELVVRLLPPFKSERVRSNVIIETGIERAPTASFYVSATVKPRAMAAPRRFTVPSVRHDDWEQSVSLVWDDGEQRKIKSAEVDDPELSVQIREINGQDRVFLKVPKDYSGTRAGRTVTLQLDDELMPELKVMVRFSAPRERPPARRRSTPAPRPTVSPKTGSSANDKITNPVKPPSAPATELNKKTEAGTDPAKSSKSEPASTDK